MIKVNVIDLFCGCGGLSYGFQSAGFDVILGIDNDDIALKTFELNHPGSKTICGDITKINYDDIKKVVGDKETDLIIGGPPCQGMSISGPRQFDDPRNKLYLSFIRLVEQIRPKIFVIENVPGIVRLFNGKIKDSIIERMESLGYNVRYQLLNSSQYGVPQYRKRIIFVGSLKGTFVFPEPNSDIITAEMAISDLPPLTDDIETNFYFTQPTNAYQKLMRKNSTEVHNHTPTIHSAQTKRIIAMVPDGGNYKDLPSDLQSIRNFHVAWTRFDSKKPAPTIDTGHRHHFHYKLNRVPTVRECARIQSFPDDFVFLGNKTQQYRQVGNAVPPLMAQKIAESIKEQMNDGSI